MPAFEICSNLKSEIKWKQNLIWKHVFYVARG